MGRTPEAFAAALASGDTDHVNSAIDAVVDISLEERASMFDACLERCREHYESPDGYQRQAVIRFADALYPQLGRRTVGATRTDEALINRETISGCYSSQSSRSPEP